MGVRVRWNWDRWKRRGGDTRSLAWPGGGSRRRGCWGRLQSDCCSPPEKRRSDDTPSTILHHLQNPTNKNNPQDSIFPSPPQPHQNPVNGQLCCPHFFPYFNPYFFPYFSLQLFPYFSIYYSVQLAYIIWQIIVYMYRTRIMREFICFYLLSMYSILVKSIYIIYKTQGQGIRSFIQYFDNMHLK